MRTRDEVLRYAEVQKDTATPAIDLRGLDPISAIELEVSCTNGATSNKGNWISDILTKVEVVDGSDSLVSLTGAELQAIDFYRRGRLPHAGYSEAPGAVQLGRFTIYFGRRLWDPQFALVPSKYKNPSLHLTFNKGVITAPGATGFAAGDNINLTVVAKIAESGLSPQGFLSQKEIGTFVSAAAGDVAVDLPTDLPYRALYLRVYELGTAADGNITDVVLNCDNGKYRPLQRKLLQLIREMQAAYGRQVWYQTFFSQNAGTVRQIWHADADVVPHNGAAGSSRILGCVAVVGSHATLVVCDNAGAAVGADEAVQALAYGTMPHAVLPIWLGDPDDPNSWLDMQSFQKAQLVLTQANAGAAVAVVAEQVRAA